MILGEINYSEIFFEDNFPHILDGDWDPGHERVHFPVITYLR